LFIKQAHESQVVLAFTDGFVVEAATAKAQQLALTADTQHVLAVDHLPLLFEAQRSSFF